MAGLRVEVGDILPQHRVQELLPHSSSLPYRSVLPERHHYIAENLRSRCQAPKEYADAVKLIVGIIQRFQQGFVGVVLLLCQGDLHRPKVINRFSE